MIHLACTLGNLGYWNYYSTLIKIEDIVSNNRIITVSESNELYTKNINEILQREITGKRIESISNYILKTDERFFSNLVVAIHKGEPKWTEINISNTFDIDGKKLDQSSINFLSTKFGVLSLNGDEEIFALDGQHRLKGLRKAYEKDKSIGDLEIPITFVAHNHEKLEKTRRLFTVLNKHAEKPKDAELIILDEDDAGAIITRRLVSEHEILSKENAISISRTGSIPNNDNHSFTTLVTLNKINKLIFKKNKLFYNYRPGEETLEELYEMSRSFWDLIFNIHPELVDYINGNQNIGINGKLINRKSESGGSLLLRPVGQELIAQVYTKFESNEIENFKKKLREIDFDLSHSNWKYVFWNGKMLGKELKLKKGIFHKLFDKPIQNYNVDEEKKRVYKLFNVEYK